MIDTAYMILLVGFLLGARPQTPWVGFAEFGVEAPQG
jgi:hypothetical protein